MKIWSTETEDFPKFKDFSFSVSQFQLLYLKNYNLQQKFTVFFFFVKRSSASTWRFGYRESPSGLLTPEYNDQVAEHQGTRHPQPELPQTTKHDMRPLLNRGIIIDNKQQERFWKQRNSPDEQ